MIDGYTLALNKIKELYPEIYMQIYHLPTSSIIGIINNLYTSKIKIENEEQMKIFFSNQPLLKEFIEVEFKLK